MTRSCIPLTANRVTYIILTIFLFFTACAPSSENNSATTASSGTVILHVPQFEGLPPADEPASAQVETGAKTEAVAALPETNAHPSADEKPLAAAVIPHVAPEPHYKINRLFRVVPVKKGENRKVALLTIDDGPKTKKMTKQMLDILDKHQIKAIFFINGYRVKSNPDLLKRIHERGHTIGNHSWEHINLRKENADNIRQQIGAVQDIVKEVTGKEPRFFRPPFGSANDDVHAEVDARGLIYTNWSNGSDDWVKVNRKPDKVVASVLKQLHPGSNILLHELPWTVLALDPLITKIKAKGYTFIDPAQIVAVPNEPKKPQ
jgi:peptidoglycan/xylan/chitin deacetylase (PgdA/CDA1 family)